MRLIDADKIDFNEVFVGASKFAEDTRHAAKMLIDAQPTINSNNGWILCNKQLPENNKREAKAYLTTNEDGMIGVSYYHHMCGWSNGYESVFDVIAWQPLPEPYREEQE